MDLQEHLSMVDRSQWYFGNKYTINVINVNLSYFAIGTPWLCLLFSHCSLFIGGSLLLPMWFMDDVQTRAHT